MKQHPLEISVFSKTSPSYKLGSSLIPWNTDSPKVSKVESSHKSNASRKKFKFKRCDSECQGKRQTSESAYSLDLSEGGAQISVTKCKEVDCNDRAHRKLPTPPDDRVLLDISNIKKDCCINEQITEKVIGGVTTKMQIGEGPCYCTCECTFGFMKKTTYCTVCGGYEVAGEELARKPAIEMPIPCPFFHKLVDKSKLKTWSTSGSESKKKGEDSKSTKVNSFQKAAASDKRLIVSEKKSVESEKDSKKGKKKIRDDRFKFNYGYKAPQIGHSRCVLPCSGILDNVPKNMGWLWTAENIPGMKFRPLWKPGATSKHVVRLLKIARNPGEVISKKKRKDTGKEKRPLKRPLLVIHKKDGEYTVTMETMKNYSKPRALNQHPYEDKPVVTYTIGRTEEENRERLKKKERARRRLERAQRHFIQDTFRDMCNEICMKTYQQALGILPETEDPACLCYPALPTSKTTNTNVSCSCSEDNSSLGSDTDSDEWIVEFTPPNATFDPTYKGKKIFKVDNGTQYTYLDYRVKLVDRFGNPVPRFFKGPDGKQQCSDLGGFWSPDNKWLEINVDGYIAQDGRWAPNIFIGPSGEHVDAEAGKFQATNGKWLIVGVDGYIDSQNRWKYYPKETGPVKRNLRSGMDSKKEKIVDKKYEKSDASWSCFGDVSPKHLSKLGIVGHGGDRKLLISTLENMLARGEDVNIPQPKTIFHLPSTKKTELSQKNIYHRSGFDTKRKCHHSLLSDKGIVAVDGQGYKTNLMLTLKTNARVHQGWKPGAVSKKLLRVLNKAKLRKSKVESIKPMRRFKKQVDDKPTLIVCKRNGTYHIEMQATNSKEDSNGAYKPLLYKIESTNNKAKIRQKEMLRKRLIRGAVKEIWSDPYHPELCEQICLKSYDEEAIGVFPKEECEDEEGPCDISCYEEDDISSFEIDWEIHFTPPLMCYQASQQRKLKSMVV
ncbi:unnamed protein product, partial [Brenthis ino]